MSTSASASAEWECTSCLENFSRAEQKPCEIPTRLHGEFDLICGECLRTQFHAAQKSEHLYPVKWQDATLHPRQFPAVFDRDFTAAYQTREKEYNTPGPQRVYCECGVFLAPMIPPFAKTSWLCVANSKICGNCEIRWCLRCAQRCGGYGVPHVCIPERRMSERRHALGGLKKGRDYQICPNEKCGKAVELWEACNAMHCQCGTDFCYICGELADHSGDHWEKGAGGCPRWGEVGSGHEIFDDDPHEDDVHDHDDEDIGAGLEDMIRWEEDDDDSTTFNHVRWAWQAAMAHGEVIDEQFDILYGEGVDEIRNIERVRAAMEMYYPQYHGGVSRAQWLEIVRDHGDMIEDWLRVMQSAISSGTVASAAEILGGPPLDIQPAHIFNMALEADRRAGAAWVRRANEEMLQHMLGRAPQPEYPGDAVFDVGPGGKTDETWRFRSLDMFKDVPTLTLYKLAGGAMLVAPKSRRQLLLEFVPAGPEVLLANPTPVDEQQGEGNNGIVAGGPLNPNSVELGEHAINTLVRLPSVPQVVHLYSGGSDRLFVHKILYMLFSPLILYEKLLVGHVDQHAYDMQYGLETRTALKIPGSWLAEIEDNEAGEHGVKAPHAMYWNVLVHGRYRVDALLMRWIFAITLWMVVCSIQMDRWYAIFRLMDMSSAWDNRDWV